MMFIMCWKKGQQVKVFQSLEEASHHKMANSIGDAQIFSIAVSPANMASDSNDSRGMRRLMYLSKATNPETVTPETVAQIAAVSSVRNVEIGVSGFLLYSEPFFFQVIEGTEDDLDFLFSKIARDQRHERCIVLANGDCKGRIYGEWNMKDTHIDSVTSHPAVKTILHQIANSFSSMWSYLPKNTASALLNSEDPATVPPTHMSCVLLYISLAAFDTIISNSALTEQAADMLSSFVDHCVSAVEGNGGTIAKFITGHCVAYFPTNRAENAVQAILQLQEALATQRNNQSPGSILTLMHARAGIHYGRALLCNAGSRKSDFTLLGECVTIAARVHNLAASLKLPILLSFEVRCLLGQEWRAQLEGAGMHQIKGRAKPIIVYTVPGPELCSDNVKSRVQNFYPKGYRASDPVEMYSELPQSDRPPIFDESPAGQGKAKFLSQQQGGQRRDSMVDRLLTIAKMAFPSEMGESDNQLITLTYISHSTRPMSRLDLQSIQRVASRRNAQSNITGSLLYVGGLFVQTLEGPKDAVMSLYVKIRVDPRHSNVVTVHLASITERVYPSAWSLAPTDEILSVFPPIQDVLGQLARSFTSLETYVPSAVVRHLIAGNNFRSLIPVSTDVIMFAADICSFTPMAEKATLPEVWMICNTFIDACTSAIVSESGEVIKLIGDCVTAYFAPDRADNALSASCELIQFTTQLREAFHDVSDVRALIGCGVGLDYGPVVMAQCGSIGITEYVVAGPAAARVLEVESLTREAERCILMTEPVADRLSPEIRDGQLVPVPQTCEDMDLYALDGDDYILDIYEVKKNIKVFHERRGALVLLAGEAEEAAATPATQTSTLSATPIPTPMPKPQQARSKQADAGNNPQVVIEVYQDACARRKETPNSHVVAKMRSAVSSETLDLGRLLSNSGELPPVVESLKHLDHLHKLCMSDNYIDDVSLCDVVDACMSMTQLTSLDLSNNSGVTNIRSLKKLVKTNVDLTEVNLHGTKVTPAEVRKLQSAINVNQLCRPRAQRSGSGSLNASGTASPTKQYKYGQR